eukprot:m.256673 g.256673  ORF g.256673 m.256673 type:complete len:686 (+) comp34577_c0_seq1:52-2109(+)
MATYLLAATVTVLGFAAAEPTQNSNFNADNVFDVVVYGATSGGVMASVAASKRGVRVALLDPGSRIGGMSAGGLSSTDVGNSKVIGGMAREFYMTNGRYYNPAATTPLYDLEPHVALAHFHKLIAEANVSLFQQTAVASVRKEGTQIKSLTTVDGRTFTAKVFVEGDYEGDLLARAGASFSVGRESQMEYNESLAGHQQKNAGHEFSVGINPYATDGSLLQMVSPINTSLKAGDADDMVQSYNFRLCVTTNKSNTIQFAKPEGYDATYWELARRYFNHPSITSKVNAPCGNVAGYCGGKAAGSNKYDLNNGGPISTDFIGGSWKYPTANYSERKEIFNQHKFYTQSFLWFMSTDPELNSTIKERFNEWGLCADEFEDTDHWTPQMYVRAARRLLGDQVFTQNTPNMMRNWGNLSVGCGSYNFDSHTAERIACPNATMCGGLFHPPDVSPTSNVAYAWNEGDVETGPGCYDIPLWALLPKRTEVTNLLVVASPSASHIGMSTLRMEPQFMIVGQSAGIIAAMVAANTSSTYIVHDVDTTKLHEALLEGGQYMNEMCTTPTPSPAKNCSSSADVHTTIAGNDRININTSVRSLPRAFTLSGGGDVSCNGVYVLDHTQQRDAGAGFYTKDSSHQIYRIGCVWRIAYTGVGVYYEHTQVSSSDIPPTSGWAANSLGKSPAPTITNTTSM